jgi:hypothetical protein
MPPNPTRVKFDLRGVKGGGRAVLPAGVYTGKITQADITKPDGKDQRIELVVQVAHNGDTYDLYEYVNLESEAAAWKLRELLEAVDLVADGKNESGTLDTKKDLLGKVIGLRTVIRPETAQYDESARIRRMFLAADAEPEDEDLDEDLDGEGGEEDEATAYDDYTLAQLRKEAKDREIPTRGLGAEDIIAALVADDEAQEGGEEPDAEGEVDDGYDDLTPAQLRATAKEAGITTVRKTTDQLIAELRELDAAAEEEEPEEGGISEEELKAMPLAQLKTLAREHGVKTAGLKRGDIVTALVEVIGGGEEEEPEADEPEPAAEATDDYDEWADDDLKTELKDRSLATTGRRAVWLQRLRRDDAEATPF